MSPNESTKELIPESRKAAVLVLKKKQEKNKAAKK